MEIVNYATYNQPQVLFETLTLRRLFDGGRWHMGKGPRRAIFPNPAN